MESFVSLGRIHLPSFGLFVAVGIMAAIILGLRTSVLAGVDRDRFWNLGLLAVLSAFVLSRVLLVGENLQLFLHFPLAVLELPALSAGGLLLTLIVAAWYIWRHRLPLVRVLEAAAPCLTLLACFERLGLYAGGMREGMPTTVPWAVGSSFGRVHPVELYEAAAWLAVSAALVWILGRSPRVGVTLAWALMLSGLADAVTDFFHLPHALYGSDTLDGVQWRGLEMIVLGSVVLAWRLAAPGTRIVGPRVPHDAI